MKKFSLSLAVLAALVLLSVDTGKAEAAHGFRGFGLHFGNGNVHVDVGRSHGYRSHSSGYHSPRRHSWHNTGHLDYHPAQRVWHGNHVDYTPGHYDYHNTSHWDRFGGRH